MPLANEGAVKYKEITDEHIKDIKVGIERFVKSNEYWDKFANHSSVDRGHKEFTSRKLIAPRVNPTDVKPRAELVAPRPTKFAVATFVRTVENYGDKSIYTKEDLQFHFDNTIANIRATLQEIAVQKLDIIKGRPFFNSKAVITPTVVGGSQSILETARRAAIILRKNKANRWSNALYLAHVTPEGLGKLRAEIEAKGSRLSEPVKRELDGRTYETYEYGDFMYSVTDSPLMYKDSEHQYVVFMGRRGIDGKSPVDVAKLKGESGIEVMNNPLGSGVLYDEDGNITSDDNKQQGSVAINMDGLGACVSDDLSILDCIFEISEEAATALPYDELSGFVSKSGNEVEIGLTAGSNTNFTLLGARHDAVADKDFAVGSTIISVQVKADAGKTLGTVTAANWSAYYYASKEDYDADVAASATTNRKEAKKLGVVKTTANNDTLLVLVPNNAYKFEIACAATASA